MNWDCTAASQLSSWQMLLILVAVIWSIFWKALALWHAARNNRCGWFIALLLINSLGLLEVIYLLGVEKVPTKKLFKWIK